MSTPEQPQETEETIDFLKLGLDGRKPNEVLAGMRFMSAIWAQRDHKQARPPHNHEVDGSPEPNQPEAA